MIKLNFEKTNGLIPAIVQDYNTNDVLMLAYMNEEALRLTAASRSPPRMKLTTSLRRVSGWMKSGFASMYSSSGSAYLEVRKW